MSRGDVADRAEADDRRLEELRASIPTRNGPWHRRNPQWVLMTFAYGIGANGLGNRMSRGVHDQCSSCRRRARTRVLITNPITLQRSYIHVCNGGCSQRWLDWADMASQDT